MTRSSATPPPSTTNSPRLGSVEPRVCNFPPGDEERLGEPAVRLARAAGLPLDEWQARILRRASALRPDGRWAAFEVGVIVPRQNGKGAILEARSLAGLFLFNERLILHSAHEFKTATEAFRRVMALIDGTPDLRRKVKKVTIGHGDEGVELINGARLRFVARSTGSGRGFTGDCVILDEAYALTAAQVEALMPTMSARPNPQIWYTSSPALDAVSGTQLMSVRDRGVAGGERMAYFDFGAGPHADLDDRAVWAATNPAYGIRIFEEFVARERAAMTPEGFARERCGVWPVGGTAKWRVLSEAEWTSWVDRSGVRPPAVAMAAQVAHDRSESVIAACGVLPGGPALVTVVDQRPGTAWVPGRLVQLRDQWRPVAIAVQDKGPAGALGPDLAAAGLKVPANPDRPRAGELAVPWASDVAAAYGMFVDALREGRLVHDDSAPLNVAVAEADTRPLGTATAWDYRCPGAWVLEAATLAHWAWVTRSPLVLAQRAPMIW